MCGACEEKDMIGLFMRRDGFKCFVSPGASHAVSPATCRMLFFLLGVLKPVFLSYPPSPKVFLIGFSHPFSIPLIDDVLLGGGV